MKRLNLKVLAIVLGVAALLGAGTYGLYQVQSRRNADKVLARIKPGAEKTDPAKTAKGLERYLHYRPDDTAVLARFGLVTADLAASGQQATAALEVLERVLGREPDREDVRRRALKLALDVGNFDAVRRHADALRKARADDPEAAAALGRAEEAAGKPEEAAKLYRAAIAQDPSRTETATRLALLLRSEELKDPAGADRIMDELIAKNPDSHPARLSRAAYRLDFAGAESAAEDIARAVELQPEDINTRIVAARIAAGRSDWEAARKHLETALTKEPKTEVLYRELAAVELRANQPARAEAVLERATRTLPQALDLRWQLAALRIEGGKLDAAAQDLHDLDTLSYDRTQLGLLEARLLMARAQWPAAARKLEAVAPALAANPAQARQANLQLATCYARLGDAARERELYQRILAGDPAAADARARYAAFLEAAGRPDEALAQYRLITDPTPEAGLALARLQIRQALGSPADRQDWPAVEANLAALEAQYPDDPRPTLLRADMLAARDRLPEARDLLDRAIKAKPDRVELWAAAVALAARAGGPAEARTRLDEAEKALGDRAALRALRAELIAAAGGPEATARVGELAKGVEGYPAEERVGLLRRLAAARTRLDDHAGALALWAPVVAQRPDDPAVQGEAFDLALRADDLPAQDAALARLKAIPGADPTAWKYARARQLAARAGRPGGDRAGLAEARTLLADLDRDRPNWPQAIVLRARLDELEGRNGPAVEGYQKAIIAGGERDPAVLRRALQLLADARRYDEAAALLARLGDGAADPGRTQRLTSELYARNEDYARALELAEKAVAAGSTDPRDHTWLGRLRFLAGRRDEAEAPYRKAVELAGDDPGPVLALVEYLLAASRRADAQAVVADREKKPAPATPAAARDRALLLARCHELIGQPDRAEAAYATARKAAPDDPALLRADAAFQVRRGLPGAAEPLLERLAGLGDRAPEDAAWARQVRALLLAQGAASDPDRARKALELVGLGGGAAVDLARAATEPLADVRARAQVLAAQPDPARRREAIALLREVARRDPGAGGDQVLLARLLEADGDAKGAETILRDLVAAAPSNPTFHVELVQALLRADRPADALTAIAPLEALQPGAPGVFGLRARALVAQKKPDEAVALVRDLATKRPDQALAAALLLEQLGQAAPAEELLRRYVEANHASEPRADLALAEFLGRQGRLKEAFDACEAARKAAPPEAVAATCTSLLAARFDAEQARRADAWLRADLAAAPSDPALQTSLAVLESLRGRVAEAEAIYRKLLEANPADVVALNNLAFLRAVHDGDGPGAVALIDRAIARAGAVPALLDTRATARLAANDPAGAIRDLEAALAAGPLPAMYFHLAQAHAKADRPDAAREALAEGRRRGLDATVLEPVERPAFAKLAAQLDAK
jgi:tetratricopeptide (TPR) repeat protein